MTPSTSNLILIVIVLFLLAAAFSLYKAFSPKRPLTDTEIFEKLRDQIYMCMNLNKLHDLEVEAGKYYDEDFLKVPLPLLNERFKILVDAIEYKKTVLCK